MGDRGRKIYWLGTFERCLISSLLLLLVFFAICPYSSGEASAFPTGLCISHEEDLTISSNWIAHLMKAGSSWGPFLRCEIQDCEQFICFLVAYSFSVIPEGYVLASSLRCLPSIKAYSTCRNFNQFSDGFEKCIIDELCQIKSAILRSPIVGNFSPENYTVWNCLLSPQDINEPTSSPDYQNLSNVEPLLYTCLGQGYPYNMYCPTIGGQWFDIFQEELDSNRVVIFSIYSKDEGHEVVVDGYQIAGDLELVHIIGVTV